MKILVTGATGLIGRKVCKELVRRKHDLAIVSRDPERASAALKLPVLEFKWDALSDPLPPMALDRVDAIVHLAGSPIADRLWTKAERQRIFDSRVRGSEALAAALSEMPSTQRPKVLVAASATGFYGDRGDEWLTEASLPGTGFLSEICTAWENANIAAGSHCARSVIVRIGIVFDSDGGALQRCLRPFAGASGGHGQGPELGQLDSHERHREAHLRRGRKTGVFGGHQRRVPAAGLARGACARDQPGAREKASFEDSGRAFAWILGDMSELFLGSARVKPEQAQAAGFKFEFESLGAALSNLITRESRAE